MPIQSENVGIAFGLVIFAGAATSLGAAVVFFPKCVKFANRKTLAGGLGLSSGVMIYVSFVEIFLKSITSFEDAGHEPPLAYLYGTLCFFGGVVGMILLNMLVTCILGGHHHHGHGEVNRTSSTNENTTTDEVAERGPGVLCQSDDPAGQLEDFKKQAAEIEEYEKEGGEHWEPKQHTQDGDSNDEDQEEGKGIEEGEDEVDDPESDQQQAERKKLLHMSANTAIAIMLHNFPEGLATFVATLDDPAVGTVLAIAIAIHNVPEGLCVAMPIYYATGNRWKAFLWGSFSGIAEPIAALLGWLVLAKFFSDTLYATLFGIVGGMMVIISVRELLPTAHRYDPEDSVVTYSFVFGMFIMALSLVLFQF